MIFVTVGTHEQPFDRLIREVDRLKKSGIIEEEVVAQIGFGTYEPENCRWSRWFPYEEMRKYIQEARIVITHGGPASFLAVLQVGKIPVVVPRQKRYGEHVNDHQVEFCREVEKRKGNIVLVEDTEKLGKAISDYHNKKHDVKGGMRSDNMKFNREFKKIVKEMGCK